MGILTLGLLGVAAIFPVGGWYLQKADIADRGSAIAQSVMSDIVARGMLNPNSWYVMVPKPLPSPVTKPGVWDTAFPSDGKYMPATATPRPKAGSFTRPFGQALNEALSQPTAATDPMLLTHQFGSAFVIDPIGISIMAGRYGGVESQSYVHAPAALFPGTASLDFYRYSNYSNLWKQWFINDFTWPIRRVTFRQPNTGWDLDQAMAEHYFRGSDDLAFDLPQRADRPAQQKWDTTPVNNSPYPLARQWTGDYSWIVTVVPTTIAARNGMATNPEGFDYDVSVVVFYKRPLTERVESVFANLGTYNPRFLSAMGANERVVGAKVLSTGLSGGELLLTDWNDYTDASGSPKSNAFEGLKVGQWIMMCGPHPNSNVDTSVVPPKGEPRFVLNWYQVISIEGKGERLNNQGLTTPAPPASDPDRRLVTLRGPEWPWLPRSSYPTAAQNTDVAKLSDNLCVAICRGAVAVHTKTMHLESSLGSTAQTFGNPGGP